MGYFMPMRGILYAINEDEAAALKLQDDKKMYDWMLENIEDRYLGSNRACELDKAWNGIHRCLNGGYWVKDITVPAKVIFSGEFLLQNESIISLKTHVVKNISLVG